MQLGRYTSVSPDDGQRLWHFGWTAMSSVTVKDFARNYVPQKKRKISGRSFEILSFFFKTNEF